MLTLERISEAGRDRIAVEIEHLIIAGWAGRDAAAIEHHIEELAALGIPRPSTTPVYYRVAAATLTQAERLVVLGPDSSGEVEPFIVSLADGLWVGLGSDHTDRKVECYGVTVSKQMCDKPMASVLWELEEVIDHWDSLILRSWAWIGGKRELYQEGTLDAMLSVPELLARGFADGKLPDGCAMFGGTFAAKGGIRPSSRFECELEDPILKRSIRHAYDVIEMPVRG